ncbi:hypothetical protein V3C99_001003, partial [Haemonchus contortus]
FAHGEAKRKVYMINTNGRQSDWLWSILDRNNRDLPAEVRVSAIRALIIECQKYGVERVMKRYRTPLRWWKIISWGVAVLRLVCATNLLVIFWKLRFKHLSLLLSISIFSSIVTLKMVNQGLALIIFMVIIFILTEILILAVIQVQRSMMIAYTYALNFLVVIFIITSSPFLAGFHAYSYRLISDMYGYALIENPVTFDEVEELHHYYQCCGFENTDDWTSMFLYRYNNLFSNETLLHPNGFEWMIYCVNRTEARSCYLPQFCCSVAGCQRMPDDEEPFAEEVIKLQKNPVLAYEYYHNYFHRKPNISGTYKTACFPKIAQIVDHEVTRTWKWLIVLVILTIIMTVLITVILLYNSGQGRVMLNLNRVQSPHRYTLVWLFMKMDEEKRIFDDNLSEYSLIQELRNFNVDLDATERE